MKRTTNRALQAQQTKKKIFDAGMDLLRSKGFDEVNISDIIKKAKVSVGTFYHYYDSKMDLFMDLYRDADHLFEDQVSREMIGKDFKESVLTFFMDYCDLVLRDGLALVRKIYVPENDLFLTEPRAMHQLLLDIIAKHGAAAKEKSSQELRDDLFLLSRGVVFDWALRKDTYPLKERMTEIIGHFIDHSITCSK